MVLSYLIGLDPLDPLTEIIKSGQAFSTAIAFERISWLMIGFFFLGAISTSIATGMKQNNSFGNKSFLSNVKTSKRKDDLPNNVADHEK